MSEKQVRRVPVVDGEGRPIGALSLNDFARVVASTRKTHCRGTRSWSLLWE